MTDPLVPREPVIERLKDLRGNCLTMPDRAARVWSIRFIDELSALLGSLGDRWQPIESEPDGVLSEALVAYDTAFGKSVTLAWPSAVRGVWRCQHGTVKPTHWMPLPDPPTGSLGDRQGRHEDEKIADLGAHGPDAANASGGATAGKD